jgi:hypothetical protein
MVKKTVNIFVLCLLLYSPATAADNVNVKEILVTESGSYHKTVSTWKTVYYELTKNNTTVRGATFIAPIMGNGYKDPKHKNKARDTIIFVPENTSFDKPIDLILYFHGLGGFKERDFRTRVLRHTKSFKEQDKNFIIVIPEMPWSKHTSTPKSRQGRVFTGKHQFSTFISSVVKIIVTLFDPSPVRRNQCAEYGHCKFNFGDFILIGHSAGGSALMSISRSGGMDWLYDRSPQPLVKVIFSDAGYGYWTDITWKYFKSKTDRYYTRFILLTRKWDKPYRHTKRFLKKIRKIPTNIMHVIIDRKISHSGIGDQTFKWVYIPEESGCGEGEAR